MRQERTSVLVVTGPSGAGRDRVAMRTRVMSFGFTYGVPADADMVFDVRFLNNPYFVEHLRELDGTAAEVEGFVLGQPEAQEFIVRTRELLEMCLTRFEREGRAYLTVAVGCTGGRHRSVVMARGLSRALAQAGRTGVELVHRDMTRGSGAPPARRAAVAPRRGAGEDGA